MNIDSNQAYNGSLSTASKFILNELNNGNRYIQCLPIDDCISFMKMIILEIVPQTFKNEILLEVKQGCYSGIINVFETIKNTYANKSPIILKVIKFLEENRSKLNGQILNKYIDECIKQSDCLCRLENQQSDIDFFDHLEKDLFSS
ncbi:unnamed protein product [Rotaria sp. Silwood2]|nr:unnamed protein product [Rotaria sp. Silwood2]